MTNDHDTDGTTSTDATDDHDASDDAISGDVSCTDATDDTTGRDLPDDTRRTDSTDATGDTTGTNSTDATDTDATDDTARTDAATDRTDGPDESGESSDDRAVLDGVARHATRLSSTDPDGAVGEFEPLRDRFAGRAVIGLGEASHGSREFFQCKHRLIRYLVREVGVRAVAFEANLPETRALDRYVVHGEGDPVAALDGVYFWTWATESVLALIEWLRSFNADRPVGDRVRFYGFDAQYTQGATESIRAFFERVDPTVLATVRDALRVADDGGVPTGEDDTLATQVDGIERCVPPLRQAVAANADRYAAATSRERVAEIRRDLRVLEQAAERKRLYADHAITGENSDPDALEAVLRARDRAMADNVAWIRKQVAGPERAVGSEDATGPQRRTAPVVCWAHDAHLNRVAHRMGDRDVAAPSMGSRLAERHGTDYVAVGFAAGRLGFRAVGPGEDGYELGEWTVDGPLPGTTEATVARALRTETTEAGTVDGEAADGSDSAETTPADSTEPAGIDDATTTDATTTDATTTDATTTDATTTDDRTHTTPGDLAVIDLRRATRPDGPDALRAWANERRSHLSVGATYEPGDPTAYLTEYAHGEAFDLLWYVPETRPTRAVSD